MGVLVSDSPISESEKRLKATRYLFLVSGMNFLCVHTVSAMSEKIVCFYTITHKESVPASGIKKRYMRGERKE